MTLPKMSIRRKSYPNKSAPDNNSGNATLDTVNPNSQEIEKLCAQQEFRLLKTVCDGYFSRITLVRKDSDKMILKAVDSAYTTFEDFKKEMDYNYFLSPHPNIITSYNVSFILDNYFVYFQEYAAYGNLSKFIYGKRGPMPLQETQVKIITQQIASALQFMHSVNLVHGDVTLENVLVVGPNMSQIKLGDFGSTRTVASLVKKIENAAVSSDPPEVCQILPQEKYYCYSSLDVWQTGILICHCLIGCQPWRIADSLTDPSYSQFVDWAKKKSIRVPDLFKDFTPRFVRLIKRLLEPKSNKRCEITEINKYLNDKWICREAGTLAPRTTLQKSESSASRMSRKSSSIRNQRINQPMRSASSVRQIQ